MRIILIFFIAITIKAQFVLTSGNYRHETVSIGDTNSIFSDTTTVGDWIVIGNGSFEDADNDSVPTYSNVPQELNPNLNFEDWSYTELVTSWTLNANVDGGSASSLDLTDINESGNDVSIIYSNAFAIDSGTVYLVQFDLNLDSGSLTNATVKTGSNIALTSAYGLNDALVEGTNTYVFMATGTSATARTGFRMPSVAVQYDITNWVFAELVPPDGWTASTMYENKYVIEHDDGLRFVSEDASPTLSITISGILVVGQQYVVKTVISNYVEGTINAYNVFTETYAPNGSGTFIDTLEAQSTNFQFIRGTTPTDLVISELSIKEYHATNNIELPLASVDGQDYRATMQMMEYDGTVAPQPIISYGTKSLTYTALSDEWQTYTFDFEGDKVNDYYEFDGIDDKVTITDDNSLDFGTGDFSVVADFTYYSHETNDAIISKKSAPSSSASVGWMLGYNNDGRPKLQVYDGSSGANLNWVDALVAGTRYHLVATMDRDGSAIMYVDGESNASTSMSSYSGSLSNSEPLLLGKIPNLFVKTNIYSAKLFNKILTPTEVTTLYNNRNSTSATTVTDSLVLDLNGIDGNASATTWSDQSGNGNDGTVSGATFKQPPYLEIELSDTSKVSIDSVIITR